MGRSQNVENEDFCFVWTLLLLLCTLAFAFNKNNSSIFFWFNFLFLILIDDKSLNLYCSTGLEYLLSAGNRLSRRDLKNAIKNNRALYEEFWVSKTGKQRNNNFVCRTITWHKIAGGMALEFTCMTYENSYV